MALEKIQVYKSFAGLASDYCFTGFNRLALDIEAASSYSVDDGYTTILDTDSTPAVEDRGKLWHKRTGSPDGAPSGRLYAYYGGAWVSPNPVAASSDERRVFVGSEADVWSYDGGDGTDPTVTPPTDAAGAMWEVDHDFDFRFPLGAGTSPKPTTVAVGDTGGSEEVTLTKDQLGGHTHTGTLTGGPNLGAAGGTSGVDEGNGDREPITEKYSWTVDIDPAGNNDPHSNMPPFLSVFFIRRTARVYYLA